MQAKDLPDRDILALVYAISMGEKRRGRWIDGHAMFDGVEYWKRNARPDAWVFVGDLEYHLPEVPTKVIMAKMRALIRRKLIDGCACGCRGDFWVTEKGREYL